MDTQKEKNNQILQMISRRHIDVDGVIDVERFDEQIVILQSVCGELTIEGKELRISILDTDKGVVSLDGQVDSVYYSAESKEAKKSFWGKVWG